ncbi:MAG: YfgM family protein [Acidiferrobacter sp.]
MDNDIIDDELERTKAFLRAYGHYVLYGLLALALVGGGTFFYYRYAARQRVLAAALYNEMLGATSQHRYGLATVAGQRLEHGFGATPYAGQAALLLARIAYTQNKLPAAEEALRFAAHHGRPWVIRIIGRLRLAQLLLATGHPHKAWTWIHIRHPGGFADEVAALQGQILAREGQTVRARAAYTRAIKLAPKKSLMVKLLRMERGQLPESP